jgi:hypothetical protein
MPEITDDDLAAAKAAVRYQQIVRYEKMYQVVDQRVQEDQDGTRPLDPRFLELGIRILKEEAALYQLGKVAVAVEEEEDPAIVGVNRAALVLAQLEDLEAKRHTQQQTQDRAA